MAQSNYALKLDSIILQKFGSLVGGAHTEGDYKNSLNIMLQVHEVSIFENLFSPVIRCEIAVIDFVGLASNFPISGEEAIIITYAPVADQTASKRLYFVIDHIRSVTISDNVRSSGYIISGVALESWANAKQKVQQAYSDKTLPVVARDIFDEHIDKKTRTFFPKYVAPPLITDNNDTQACTYVVPNLNPFSAISLIGEIAVNESNEKNYTYLFYQTINGFNFRTLQGLFSGTSARATAKANGYVYLPNEIDRADSGLKNEGRVVSNLIINKRIGSFQKLSGGYFHNNLFEINIAQKAVWGTDTKVEEINTIYENKLNTDVYTLLAYVEGNEEESNRTKYVVTTQRENDGAFPLSRSRKRWGKDMMSKVAMSQVDLTVTIPGTDKYRAGSLFYLTVPEFHGFEELKQDDFISGLYVVTEVKHLMMIGGFHTTVLRINRDSYSDSIDRESRFARP